MTTADYRKAAVEAELTCCWYEAACLWRKAIDNYPNPQGALAQRDISNMQNREHACRVIASAA